MKEIVIANLSIDFALRIVNLYKYLTNDKSEYVLSKQVLRSGTSIGANIAESEHAQSTADFISKLYIALKEANESKYWITLLYRSQYINEMEHNSIMHDLNIIIGTLVNTIKKTKNNKAKMDDE
ncbi:MAG: four helix bundle protein [Bacteroidaceae bacterium]|nr:four helix bundle protein [Bacteroidaceae bacterium]